MIHQTGPEPVRVARVPWLVLLTGCSLLVALVLLVLAVLPATGSGILIAVLGGAFGAGAVLYPQPAAQVVAAGQPGAVLGLGAVALLGGIRWYARRRANHLPGFTRIRPEPSGVGSSAAAGGAPASVRSRAGSTGSAGAPAPIAPSGSGS